jgi:hypothetical protein
MQILVKVKPSSKIPRIIEEEDNSLTIYLTCRGSPHPQCTLVVGIGSGG